MVIEGAVDIGNKRQHVIDSDESIPEGESTGLIIIFLSLFPSFCHIKNLAQILNIFTDLVILIIGTILMLIGLLMLSYYVRAERRRKNCPCFPSKEQRMARQLRENQAGNGQVGSCTNDIYLWTTAP